MTRTRHRALRLAFASLLATALAAQLAIGLSRPGLTVVRFFSYFTVLSNTSAVVMLTLLAARPRRDESTRFAIFRGAVTVYMGVTGIVYAAILAPGAGDVGLTEPWVDWVLHVIGPVAVAVDWVVSRPPVTIPTAALPIWLVFPAAYLGYTLIRGPIVDWYPYPILDPHESDGYGEVVLWSVVVLVVIVALGALHCWWANRETTGARTT